MKQLPRTDSLQRLAWLAGPYPIPARTLVSYAKYFGLNHGLAGFLQLFHPDEVFYSRTDFINRCEELELLIEQEKMTPKEFLCSPQD